MQEYLILTECALCDLDVEHVARYIVAYADVLNRLQYIQQTKIHAREVDRGAQHHPVRQCAAYGRKVPAYLLDDVEIELRREVCLLQYGHKDAGRNHPMDGVVPTRQCFKSADFTRHYAHLRLVEYLDKALLHRLVERADDMAAEIDGLLHRGVELRPCEVIRLFNAVAGDLGTVHDEHDVRHICAGAVDTRLDLHGKPQLIGANALMDELDAVCDIFPRCRDGKMVIVKACNQIVIEDLPQQIRHIA